MNIQTVPIYLRNEVIGYVRLADQIADEIAIELRSGMRFELSGAIIDLNGKMQLREVVVIPLEKQSEN